METTKKEMTYVILFSIVEWLFYSVTINMAGKVYTRKGWVKQAKRVERMNSTRWMIIRFISGTALNVMTYESIKQQMKAAQEIEVINED